MRSIERGDKLNRLVEAVIRTTEDELILRLEAAQTSAEGLAVANEYNVTDAREHFVKEVQRQQGELELFVKRLRTLDELRKRSPLERYGAWTGPISLGLLLGKLIFDALK